MIGIPLEIAWASTVSWWADWLTCKIMVFLRIFGYFLSGNILMAISVDRQDNLTAALLTFLSPPSPLRFSAIVFPISHRSSAHRTRLLLGLGWALAALCSIPQSIVFSLETHPVISTYRQCINTVALTNQDRELLYFLYFFILSWVLPILVMMVCYVSIIITIFRRTKKSILGRRMSKFWF